MVYCAALNCKNSSTKKVRFFRFPASKERRDKWAQNCGRGQWSPTDNSRLCEIHFEESQYELGRADGRKLLKWNALPTIFDVSSPPKSMRPKRKPPKGRVCFENNSHIANVLEEDCSIDDQHWLYYPSSPSLDPERQHPIKREYFENESNLGDHQNWFDAPNSPIRLELQRKPAKERVYFENESNLVPPANIYVLEEDFIGDIKEECCCDELREENKKLKIKIKQLTEKLHSTEERLGEYLRQGQIICFKSIKQYPTVN